jgi:hypothetical protein
MRTSTHGLLRAATLAATLLLAACGSDDDDAPTGADEWLGATPHADLGGAIGDTTIDLSFDETAAADLERAFCKREYAVPDATDMQTWTEAVMPEIEATFRVTEDGLEKQFELSLAAADFTAATSGTSYTVVAPVEDQDPAAGQVVIELDYQWEDPAAGLVSYEGSATGGTVALALLDGTPGADGKIIPGGTGHLGVFLDATWPEGSLRGSFTVRCGDNEVE